MRFMVSIHIVVPPERAGEAESLLPAEGAHVAEHKRQGVLETLYVDAATPHESVWAVMRADSLEDVKRLVESYPMHDFFRTIYTQISED